MRLAVYAIALNEEQFVSRWYESTKDADFHLIADTGSTDKTVAVARKLGITVVPIHVSPWRFDMARNVSLALLPEDIDLCIPLDLDEVMLPGYRDGLEREWAKGVTRPRYDYVFSWSGDQPNIRFFANKIHARRGYRWKYPIHEVAECYDGSQVETINPDIVMHHLPDQEKSRRSYLPLLEMATIEDPWDARCAYYYGRELHFRGRQEQAAAEFRRYLALPGATWNAERAHTYRWLARCEPGRAIEHLEASVRERDHREAWVDLGWCYYTAERWQEALDAVHEALRHTAKSSDYQTDGYAWGPMAPDFGSVAAFHLGDQDEAIRLAELALSLNPDDDRVRGNLEKFRGQTIPASV